jgi:uncharacterized Fe-S center protein
MINKKTDVYFIDFKTNPKQNILQKLNKLLQRSGFDDIDYQHKITAIKIHFGEPGNMSYIRPNYAAEVVRRVKQNGGLPFLTDCNTLYKGRRSNAIDHLLSASENGFNRLATGCDVIIADGLKGTEYREVEVNQVNVKKAKIGSAIADADIVISMNHFKGLEMTGFGGALKNLGMGCGSVGGKLEMHSDEHPVVQEDKCTSCGVCIRNCAHNAISLNVRKKAEIDSSICVGCGQCVAVCMFEAAQAQGNSARLQEKIAEYALAVVKDKPTFHINFIMDVSPNCDCWGYNDVPIVPNIGILASFNPVALDVASANLVNNKPLTDNCCISGGHHTHDHFTAVHPDTNWELCVNHAVEIGVGARDYNIIQVE